jgi:flavodoxin I
MKALIVYDSFYGNTEEVARAIAGVLALSGTVTMARPGEVTASALDGVNLVVVGSPTRAFRPTPAVMKWIRGLAPDALNHVRIAGFDTRFSLEDTNSKALATMVKFFGYAAEPITKALQKKGGVLAAPPEGFFVGDKEGQLKDGERTRAEAWARQLSAPATGQL